MAPAKVPLFTLKRTALRISRRKFKPKTPQAVYYVNEQIRVPQVRVIDEDEGHIGILPTDQAIQMARGKDLDLVVIQPKAEPPIAKITEFGKYKYEEEKKQRQQKANQKTVEVKGIRLSLRIGDHDKDVRKEQAKRFMENGDKVKVEIILRGREKSHGDLARTVIENFIKDLNQEMPVKVEQPIVRQGGQLTSVVGKA